MSGLDTQDGQLATCTNTPRHWTELVLSVVTAIGNEVASFGVGRCGQEELVDFGADFTVELVDFGADLTVEYVDFGSGT